MSLSTCHPNRLHYCKNMCRPCYEKWLRQTNPEYRSRQIKNTSDWFKRHPNKRKELNHARRLRELADPLRYVKKRSRMLKSKYGITLEDYETMLSNQRGGCAVCERSPGKLPLHVDHDHNTGKVRGLLCHQCNWYLGTLERSSVAISNLLGYLEKAGIKGRLK